MSATFRGRLLASKKASELKEGDMIYWGDHFPQKVLKTESLSDKMLLVFVESRPGTPIAIKTSYRIRKAANVGLHLPYNIGGPVLPSGRPANFHHPVDSLDQEKDDG